MGSSTSAPVKTKTELLRNSGNVTNNSNSQDAGSSSQGQTTADSEDEVTLPEDQQKFDTALRFSCNLIKPDSVEKLTKKGVSKLELKRSLPSSISLYSLVTQLKSLEILDISGNHLGAAGFRTVLLSLRENSTITTLNVANNQTDTDCAACIGEMLDANHTLTNLDVSGNYLGKDYFSRCVGAALLNNTTLKVLKCESIGSTDLNVLGESLKSNSSLETLNINSNELSNAKSFIESLARWIKSSKCVKCVEIRNTGIKAGHLPLLTDGLRSNTTLKTLNVSANQSGSSSELLELVVACVCHPSLKQCVFDDINVVQVDSWKPKGKAAHSSLPSQLEELSLSTCQLNDTHFKALLTHLGESALSTIYDLNISNNPELTHQSLIAIHTLTLQAPTIEEKKVSSVRRLNISHNTADHMVDFLLKKPFINLNYLNLRRCKVNGDSLVKLKGCVQTQGIDTLVLDSIKFSGTHVLKGLLGDKAELCALSLSGCQLNDDDLQPIWDAIKANRLPMAMLKLSANRISNKGISEMCAALQSQKTHPLALVDMSNNNIGTDGGKFLSELLLHKKHRSQLHSLNLNHNNIGSDGVVCLVSCLLKSSLLSLNVSEQTCSYGEEDMMGVFAQLANSLGLKLEDGVGKAESCDLPSLPSGLSVRLHGLGGEPGDLGCLLDCSAITTDFAKLKTCSLTLQDVLQLAAALRQSPTPECLLSSKDWEKISGADKEAPSWLRLADKHNKAVYMTGLPASVTVQKMEGLLETEADCNVDEVCLMKDVVTRKNNGIAWALFSDVKSAEQALDFYNTGQARVFNQPFTMSRLLVQVDDEASTEASKKAKEDIAHRLKEKQKDQAAHSALIQKAYVESQERHAYRLAHPAYADGRIW